MNQSGGFFKKLGNRINEHENPHVEGLPTDCCPCVFSFLGVPPEIYIPLQHQFGTGQGMTPEQLEITLRHISNTPGYNYNWEMKKADIHWGAKADQRGVAPGPDGINRGPGYWLNSALTELYSLIPNGFGTLGGFYRLDGTGHCIALGKQDDGTPIIYDVQQGRWFTQEQPGWHADLGQDVTNYFVNEDIKYLYYLHGTINGEIIYEDESGGRINPGGQGPGVGGGKKKRKKSKRKSKSRKKSKSKRKSKRKAKRKKIKSKRKKIKSKRKKVKR
tara:strand:- start:97 stop:918 length:822 start_codon:yes stop_codon:yes gene_type:complete